METVKFYIEKLPEPYRGQALANMSEASADKCVPNQSIAISGAFNWAESPEGTDYWYKAKELFTNYTL